MQIDIKTTNKLSFYNKYKVFRTLHMYLKTFFKSNMSLENVIVVIEKRFQCRRVYM